VWHDAFIRVTRLSNMCVVNNLHVWHDRVTRTSVWRSVRGYMWCASFILATWLIHMCDVTHSYVWHDSFICMTWLIYMCDMIWSHAQVFEDLCVECVWGAFCRFVVCMFTACMYICLSVCLRVCIHESIYAYISLFVCVHGYTHTRPHTDNDAVKPVKCSTDSYVFTNYHIDINTRTHDNMYTYICTYVVVCTYIFAHMLLYVPITGKYVYKYGYRQTCK